MPKMLSATRSFAQFKIVGIKDETSSKLVFVRDNRVYVVDENKGDPTYFKGSLPTPERTGKIEIQTWAKLLTSHIDS